MAAYGETDIPFHVYHNCEDQFFVSAVESADRASYYLRDERHPLNKMTHAGGVVTRHPEHPDILYRNANNHILCNDTPLRMRWWWREGQFSEDRIKAAVDYFQDVMPEASIVYDMDERLLDIRATTVWSKNQREFAPVRPEYGLFTEKARFDISTGARFLCIIRMADDYQDWKTEWRDLMAGETCQLKRNTEDCYFVFSTNVSKGGTELEAFKPYRLSREAVDISCTENTKIVRISR